MAAARARSPGAIAICAHAGCSKPVFVDRRSGIAHDYCSRSHAELALGHELAPPHGMCMVCKLRGCSEPVYYDEELKRTHDFCSRGHARLAIERGEWSTPLSNMPCDGRVCALFGCNKPCWQDPTSTIQVGDAAKHSYRWRRLPTGRLQNTCLHSTAPKLTGCPTVACLCCSSTTADAGTRTRLRAEAS